ncbi:M10 family metallopeptidase [Ramlibacter sp.]|uniref:M10 family metallopeptidase n=1 Tax=Ramlibacter sp. TaxID=1917967 RepID=UPI003D0D0F42
MPSPTGSSLAASAPSTGDLAVDALLAGNRWRGAVTYSFPETDSAFSTAIYDYGPVSGAGEPWTGFRPLGAAERAAFAQAMAAWSVVANISVTPVADTRTAVGDIRVAYSGQVTGNVAGWAYEPGTPSAAGDIWLNLASLGRVPWTPGGAAFKSVLHEIGHALGLKHPFEEAPVLPAAQDSLANTVMSYSALPGVPASTFNFYPTTPMVQDIAALQALYGPNTGWATGADTYAFDDSAFWFQTLWDAGGNDMLRYDGIAEAEIDLRDGAGSSIGRDVVARGVGTTLAMPNIWIAKGALIENATGGAAADTLQGNDAANRLEGRDGDDRLSGGAGVDVAVFSAAFRDYDIARVAATGGWTVADRERGRDGTDTLVGMERVRFADGEFALDAGIWAAQLTSTETLSLLGAWRGAQGGAPAALDFGAAAAEVRTTNLSAWAVGMGAQALAGNAEAAAKKVLGNFGISETTLGGAAPAASFAALGEAVGMIFDAFAPVRGQVVLNVANLLRGLESDSVFGAIARGFNARVNGDYAALAPAAEMGFVSLVGLAYEA